MSRTDFALLQYYQSFWLRKGCLLLDLSFNQYKKSWNLEVRLLKYNTSHLTGLQEALQMRPFVLCLKGQPELNIRWWREKGRVNQSLYYLL